MNNKKNLFFGQIGGFLIIQIFGLLTGLKIFSQPTISQQFFPTNQKPISVLDFLFSFVLSFLFILLFLRIFKKKKRPFKLLFYFLILSAGSIVFFTWFGHSLISFILLIAVLIIFHFFPIILFQDILIAICVVGAAVLIGGSLLPWQMIIILLILAVYDLIMVFGTGKMVVMFKDMMAGQMILALVVPENFKGLKTKINQIETGKGFIFLGTGDLALPMAFAISALHFSLTSSIFILIGSFLGLLILTLYFLNQRRPLPALPPIIVGAILGYLISFL